MMQSDVDHTLFAGGNAGDDKLFVKFENKPVQDKTKTAAEGRPIFKEVPHVSIRAAGSQHFVCRAATLADKQRFPRHFAAFEQKKDMPVIGTLLSEWPLISRTMMLELGALDVKTVEQLLSMSDANSQNFMGINELKKKAKLYLEHAAGDAPMNQLQDDLEDAHSTIARQQEQIAQMLERITALEPAASAELMNEPETTVPQVSPKPRRSRAK